MAITAPSEAPASAPVIAEDHRFDFGIEADRDNDKIACGCHGLRRIDRSDTDA
jgi:hypothetical protein